MKLKHVVQFNLIVVLVACFFIQPVHAIMALGANPVCKDCVKSAEDVRSLLVQFRPDMEDGLTKAGYPELIEPLYAQLQDTEIVEVEYTKGQELEWMFYRKKGKGPIRVDQGVIWESDIPLKSYEFHIDYNDQRYTMTMPPACSNLALVGVGPIPVEPVVAPPVTTSAVEGGDPGSGVIAQEAVQEDDSGRWPILFDLGYLHQLDPAHHLIARVGTEYYLNDSISLVGMIGAAPKVAGSDGESAFVADIFANYNFSRYWVGLGVGAWLTSGDSDNDAEDSDFDVILNMGARIFGEPDAFNTSLFLEARSDVDEFDDFDLYGRFGGGLRFRF